MNYLTKQRLAEYYILFRMYYGRGYGHFSFVTDIIRNVIMGGVFIELVDRWFHYRIPLWMLGIAAVGQYVVCFGIGVADKKVGMWQFEANYSARKLNPWNDEVLKRIKNIENKIK